MPVRRRVRSVPFALLLPLLVPLAPGCGGDDGPGPTTETAQDFLAAVATTGGVQATFRTGSPPAAGGGPVVTVPAANQVVVGGSVQMDLVATAAFQRIAVFVEGVAGYWEIALPAAQTQTGVVVTLDQTPPRNAFSCVVSLAAAGGEFGARGTMAVTAIPVGTGDVQVSVSWDAASDVDLHVVEPSGEEIFYGHEVSATGGRLDLDSNAACLLDNVRNENITWATGTAPSGQYVVRVDYWDACGVAQTKYTVTVRVAGQAPKTFTGTFTGGGDQGGAGAGVQVTTFTR